MATTYEKFLGKAKWTQIYKPDEFRGTKKWKLTLYMDDPDMWEKFKKLGIQKEIKKDADGQYFTVSRDVVKMIKGQPVYFAPPMVFDREGKALVEYVGEDGKWVRSYNAGEKAPDRKGDPVLIGNGSEIEVTLAVYPTTMGVGNRLESIKVIDLIHYESPPAQEEAKETVKEEPKTDKPKKQW